MTTSQRIFAILSCAFLVATVSIDVGAAVLNACVNRVTGNVRIVELPTACAKNELPLSWNQQGPKGDTGATGATGATGPKGADANLTFSDACSGDVASTTTCSTNSGSCTTRNYPCTPYTCDAAAQTCATSCISSFHCAQGASCDTITGRCAARHSICVDAFVIEGVDGQLASCQPYRCLNGMCQQQCVGNVDCSDGFHCASSRCVAD